MGQKSSLVIIGNEILSGRTQDSNTRYIADKMGAHGVPLAEVRVVPDIEVKIIEAVNALRAQYDYVFTTGGIGPTHDDITAESVAKALGVEFERHEGAYKDLLDYYGPDDLTDARASMAMMPKGAELLPNPVSGAPGFFIENVYVMAGVPKIMQAMLAHVIDTVAPGEPILSNTITCNVPESQVADEIGQLELQYEGLEIGSYPHFRSGSLGVSLVLRSTKAEVLRPATQAVLALIEHKDGVVQALGLAVPID